jgi:hypothetical protein
MAARRMSARRQVAIKLIRRGMDSISSCDAFATATDSGWSRSSNIAKLLDGGSTEDGLPTW